MTLARRGGRDSRQRGDCLKSKQKCFALCWRTRPTRPSRVTDSSRALRMPVQFELYCASKACVACVRLFVSPRRRDIDEVWRASSSPKHRHRQNPILLKHMQRSTSCRARVRGGRARPDLLVEVAPRLLEQRAAGDAARRHELRHLQSATQWAGGSGADD